VRSLGFDYTDITDVDLNMIAKLPALEWLGLNGTAVTDAGVAQLGGIKTLWRLELTDTFVTEAMVERLRIWSHNRAVNAYFFRKPEVRIDTARSSHSRLRRSRFHMVV
jgi:hypothetical protein